MRLPLLCLLLAAGLFAACKEDGKPASNQSATTTPAPHPTPKSDLNSEQTAELMRMIADYYTLKDALVATNASKADQAASRLLSSAEMMGNDINDAPQGTEIHPQLKTIMNGCDSIIAYMDETTEVKRKHFATVSDAMYKVLKAANLKHGGVYQQYCPMAFDNKGAYWLAAEEEIKNPYFGKKMIECGEVKDSF